MGAVENLAVAQLPLQVAHDALPQGGHSGQVVRVCLVHDAKDALPAFIRHDGSFHSGRQAVTALCVRSRDHELPVLDGKRRRRQRA